MKNTNVEFSKEKVFIGIDVSKEDLEFFDSKSKKSIVFKNTRAGHRRIVALSKKLGAERICLEATGGYEKGVLGALLEAGLPACLVNPKRVREFARGHGINYKTDAIDAEVLALYGQQILPNVTVLASEKVRRMSALSRRREQIKKMLTAEKCRLDLADKEVRREIKSHIRYLERQTKKLEEKMRGLFDSSELTEDAAYIESIPGVGAGTSFVLLTGVPETGSISNRSISALVGVAPFTQRSGKWRGREKIQGGRELVRTKLYMAAHNVVLHNPHFTAYFEKIISRGKPYKVAMVAVMRKLLCLCNTLVKNKTKWDPSLA